MGRFPLFWGGSTSWHHTVDFSCGPAASHIAPSTVLTRGVFRKLRLYHVLDLVRLVSDELPNTRQRRDATSHEKQANDEDFAFLVASILRVFSVDWVHLRNDREFPWNAHSQAQHRILGSFCARWIKNPITAPFDRTELLRSPFHPTVSLEKRPLVSGSSTPNSLVLFNLSYRTMGPCFTSKKLIRPSKGGSN